MNKPNRRVKTLILGMSAVGKSSLMLQFIEGDYLTNSYSTIGVDIKRRSMTLQTGHEKMDIILELWDTAGQERFRTFIGAHFRQTDRAILVYDITSFDSFREIDFWRKELSKFTDLESEQIYIVGNKADLESMREVTTEKLQEYAEHYGFGYGEVSATNKEQIEQLFTDVVIRAPIKEPIIETSSVYLAPKVPKKRDLCCRGT